MIARLDDILGFALIRRGVLVVALCAAFMLVATVAFAGTSWFEPTKLYTLRYDSPDGRPVFDQSAWIELTPSYTQVGNLFVYEYMLNNTNAGETIGSFALTFTDVRNRDIQFTDFRPLVGWGHYNAESAYVVGTPSDFQFTYGRELIWYAPTGGGLAPGQSMTFGFTTSLDPGSHQDNKTSGMGLARGYNGLTYGPGPDTTSGGSPAIPELPSVLLGIPGLAFVSVLKTRIAGSGRRVAR